MLNGYMNKDILSN